MNPAASRAQLVRGMQSLHLAGPAPSRSRATAVAMAAARGISTTTTQRGKNTDWVRGKLWKGEAPGAADPYTQRPEPEVAQASEADAATTVESSLGDSTAAQQQQQQGVPLPPRRSAAATITDVKAADPTYEPATSLEELAEVQPLSQWWEQPGHWTARDEFRGFPSPEVVRDPAVIEVYLRRALVEVLALRDTASFRKWSTQTWSEGRGTGPVLDAEVAVRDGNAFLTANVRTINMDLKTGRKHRVAGRHQKRMDAAEAAKLIERWSPEWKKTVLRDAQKFVIRKRLYQLTGHLMPDAKLAACTTAEDMLAAATKAPKAQPLAEILAKVEGLQSLPNVKVHARKVGLIDKENAIGRWKLMEAELRKRGLPVSGKVDAEGPMEKKRMWAER